MTDRNSQTYIKKASNVTDEMCQWTYWTDDMADCVIMSEKEVNELNACILNTKGTNMSDLDKLDQIYNATEMATNPATFDLPEGMYLNGRRLKESQYEAIRKNISDAAVTGKAYARFGICINRTILKKYPYNGYMCDNDRDTEWDEFAVTAIRFGEPLILYNVTADGKFVYARCSYYEGWANIEDIAVCKDKAEWQRAKNHSKFIVVTGERIMLEPSSDADISQKQMTMGTVLEIADTAQETIEQRFCCNNYKIKIPVRNADGSYGEKCVLIPQNRDVNIGYLPYTRENVLKQAFKLLGNRYGWGGILDSQDCSGFIKDVYSCFGFDLPRDTTAKAAMPVGISFEANMTETDKRIALNATPAGAILQFPGHEMIYLGAKNGLYYTISAVSSLIDPKKTDIGVIRPRSIMINDLSAMRPDGTNWMSNLNRIITIRSVRTQTDLFSEHREITKKNIIQNRYEQILFGSKISGKYNRQFRIGIRCNPTKRTCVFTVYKADNSRYTTLFSCNGVIGKNGTGKVCEGDRKTPYGTFIVRSAYGIKDDPGSIVPYTKITAGMYWRADAAKSDYNTLVYDSNSDNDEHLADYDGIYNYLLDIGYNSDCVPHVGSGIFLHCLSGDKSPTSGCIAISEKNMIRTLRTITPLTPITIY